MRTALAMAALVVALVVAIELPNLPAGRVPSEDAGVFFYIAQRMLEGGVPYRDVWDHKPPVIYVLDAIGLAVAGPMGAWIVQVVVLAVGALLGLRTLRTFGETPALVGSLAWIVAAPRLFLAEGTQTTYAEVYAVPLQFATMALGARELEHGRPRRALAIGAITGVALLIKPTLIGTGLAVATAMVALERRSAMPRLAAIAGGGAIVVALASLPFVLAGASGDAFDQIVRYNLAYSAFAAPADRLAAIAAGIRLTLPSGLAAIALAAWLVALLTRRTGQSLLTIALVALPLELLLASAGRGYHYYFVAWLPSMAVLTAFAAAEVQRRAPARAAAILLAIAVVAMSVRPAMLVTRLASVGDDGLVRAAAAYVQGATLPGDRVLVWGSRVEVLFLADRAAPTRYVYQYAALETRGYADAARVAEFLAQLERDPPALILDASPDSFVTPPLDRQRFSSWVSPEPQYAPHPDLEGLLGFVETRYTASGVVPGTSWTAWRLRAP